VITEVQNPGETRGICPAGAGKPVVEGDATKVLPLPIDPVKAFRGSDKKGMVDGLLMSRRLER
jgi:hypothetical protein